MLFAFMQRLCEHKRQLPDTTLALFRKAHPYESPHLSMLAISAGSLHCTPGRTCHAAHSWIIRKVKAKC